MQASGITLVYFARLQVPNFSKHISRKNRLGQPDPALFLQWVGERADRITQSALTKRRRGQRDEAVCIILHLRLMTKRRKWRALILDWGSRRVVGRCVGCAGCTRCAGKGNEEEKGGQPIWASWSLRRKAPQWKSTGRQNGWQSVTWAARYNWVKHSEGGSFQGSLFSLTELC